MRRMIQIISLVGALVILAAYAANQLGRLGPLDISYSLLNLVGAATLTVVAALEDQYGFLLLEAVWTAVSAWALLRFTRPRQTGAN
jgi:Na+/H+ antiporter NhaD/arsenite permease-like protein